MENIKLNELIIYNFFVLCIKFNSLFLGPPWSIVRDVGFSPNKVNYYLIN